MAKKDETAVQGNNDTKLPEVIKNTVPSSLIIFGNTSSEDSLDDLMSEAAPTTESGKARGLEKVNHSDRVFAKFKILQSNSIEVIKGLGKAGHFFEMASQKPYEELSCILLGMNKLRVMWKKPFKRGEDPVCRSFDGEAEVGTNTKLEGTNGGNCRTCKFAKWNNESADKRPPCNFSYAWLGLLNDENRTVFRIIFSGSGIGPTKNFLTSIVEKGKGKWPPFYFPLKLTTELVQGDQAYYQIKYNYDVDNHLGVITASDLNMTVEDKKDPAKRKTFLDLFQSRVNFLSAAFDLNEEIFDKTVKEDMMDTSDFEGEVIEAESEEVVTEDAAGTGDGAFY